MNFIQKNQLFLSETIGLSFEVTEEHFNWAWMNVGTRCFGTHHLPSDIAMVPLLDLINHDSE